MNNAKYLISESNLEDKNFLVRKSNLLIMNSKYDLNSIQQKLIILLASKVKPEDQDFKRYKLKVKDYMNLLSIKDQSFYVEMPKITKELLTKVVEIEDDEKLIQCSWLSCAVYEKGTGEIELEFSPTLKPYMLELNQRYTQYEIKNIISLKDKYSIRIYEILKCYQFRGELETSVENFKKLISVADDQYTVYGNFKNRVLKKAQKELKNTDISFELEEIKTGRKVTDLKFIIRSNKNHINDDDYIETESRVLDEVEELSTYFNEEFTKSQIEAIFNNANGDLENIKEVYTYLKNDYNTKNLVGAMMELVKPNIFKKPISNESKYKIKKNSFHNFTQNLEQYGDIDEILRQRNQEEIEKKKTQKNKQINLFNDIEDETELKYSI